MWSVYIAIFLVISIVFGVYFALKRRNIHENYQDVMLAKEGKELLLVHVVSLKVSSEWYGQQSD